MPSSELTTTSSANMVAFGKTKCRKQLNYASGLLSSSAYSRPLAKN